MPEESTRLFKTTVEIEGESHEVEVSLPDGTLTANEIRENYVPKSDMPRRLDAAKRGRHTVEEFGQDEDLLTQIASSHDDWFREHLKIDGEKPDIGRLEETWQVQHVKPLADELKTVTADRDDLRGSRLDASVSSAAVKLGVKKSHMELLTPYYRNSVKWSDEYRDWFIVDRKGEFEYSATPDEGAPYLTIHEDLERKHRSGEKADWFDGKGQIGPDYQGGGGGRPGTVDFEAFKQLSLAEQSGFSQVDMPKYREYMTRLQAEREAVLQAR